jgi:hypothetical protein
VGHASTLILGVDFTCAPRASKAITVAFAHTEGADLVVDRFARLADFGSFERLLAEPGPWIGGFDFPFGMPAELIRDLNWPGEWRALVAHCEAKTRADFRAVLNAYRATRPVGGKYAHRKTDGPAGSHSPMKLVNPPVALMFHEGARRLAAAGVHIPLLAHGDRSRIALEAYPGLLARSIARGSYKSDTRSKQTVARKAVRKKILTALRTGRYRLGVRVKFSSGKLEREALADGSGDLLDAVLCAVQAGWASRKPRFGLPRKTHPCEGWIVSA